MKEIGYSELNKRMAIAGLNSHNTNNTPEQKLKSLLREKNMRNIWRRKYNKSYTYVKPPTIQQLSLF